MGVPACLAVGVVPTSATAVIGSSVAVLGIPWLEIEGGDARLLRVDLAFAGTGPGVTAVACLAGLATRVAVDRLRPD